MAATWKPWSAPMAALPANAQEYLMNAHLAASTATPTQTASHATAPAGSHLRSWRIATTPFSIGAVPQRTCTSGQPFVRAIPSSQRTRNPVATSRTCTMRLGSIESAQWQSPTSSLRRSTSTTALACPPTRGCPEFLIAPAAAHRARSWRKRDEGALVTCPRSVGRSACPSVTPLVTARSPTTCVAVQRSDG